MSAGKPLKDNQPLDGGETWERRTKESSRAYDAFLRYRNMGPMRSFAKLAKEMGKTSQAVAWLAARHEWTKRIRDWEISIQREEEAARRVAIRDAMKRHSTIAQMVQKKLVDRLKSMHPDEVTSGVMAHWLDVAVKIERMSMGLSASTVAGSGQGGQFEHTHSIAIREAEESLSRILGTDLAESDPSDLVAKP